MSKSARLRVVTDEAPTTLSGSTIRQRSPKRVKFLTEAQVEALAKAADSHRDRMMIMVAYRHGLRVSELVSLRWDQIDLDAATLRIYRAKHGRDATHPIPGTELRDFRRLKREGNSEFVFLSRLGGPMTPRAFAQMLVKAGNVAGLSPVNPHALRHACGYKLASDARHLRDIQHYLGHRRVQSTEIYTEAAPTNFRGFFR
jgi:type 1 fimbriae regulatory protein FimB/type 1 fimbriae regulatory protein FimE